MKITLPPLVCSHPALPGGDHFFASLARLLTSTRTFVGEHIHPHFSHAWSCATCILLHLAFSSLGMF